MKTAGLFILVFVLLAFASNPDAHEHHERLKAEMAQTAGVNADKWWFDMIATQAAKSTVSVSNYFVCSVGRVDGAVVTVGAFSKVFIVVNPKIESYVD
jgi:hypothetical protein